MAATDASPIPFKGSAYRVTFPILDADGDLVTAATGLDSEISKDGGTFADCTNEATEIATGSGMYFLDLTGTEMTADTVAIICKTTSSGAKTTPLILYPNKAGGLAVNVTAWAGNATTTGDIAIKTTLAKTTHITGFNDISTANVQTELGTYGALKPTTAGRTLDVTTTGEAGVDWANIGAPTTAVNLSGTTISTAQAIASVSGAVGSVTGAVGSVTAGVALTSGERTTLAGVIWNVLTAALTTASSIGKLLVDNINATISSRSTYAGTDTAGTTTLLSRVPTTAASQASVDAVDDFVDSEVSAIKAVTDKLDTALELDGAVYRYTVNALEQAPVGGGGGATDWTSTERDQIRHRLGIDGAASSPTANPSLPDAADISQINSKLDALSTSLPLDASELNAIADTLLKRDWTALSGEAAYSALNAFRMLRNVWSTAGNTLTVKKEDGTTTAWTRTLSTDPTAAPITGAT